MKLKIDKEGNLSIERAGKMKEAWCHDHGIIRCGDWCPLFGEPVASVEVPMIGLKISQDRILSGDLVDERE